MKAESWQEETFERRFDAGVWRKVFGLLRPHWREYSLVMLAMALLAGVDVAIPLVTRHAIDAGIVAGDRGGIYRSAALFGVLILVQGALVGGFIAGCGRIGARVNYELRRRVFAHLQGLSVGYFDRTPVGWIMARAVGDSPRVGETLTWGAVDFVWGAVMMILMAGAMLAIDWRLAGLVLGLVPLILAVSLAFQKRIIHRQRQVRRLNSELTAAFNETIMGVRVIKALVQEEAEAQSFQGLAGSMYHSSYRAAVLVSLYLPLISLIGAAGSALVVALGGDGVIAGRLTYGTLVAFVTYTRRFFDPANQIAHALGQFQETQAAAERLFSLLAVEPEVLDEPGAEPGGRIRGHVEFRHVDFSYSGRELVLRDFCLQVAPGETIALVGPTGGGKTTVVNLLARFHDPTRGVVLVDGVDLRKRPQHWLRSQLGVVLQTPHLFAGTIEENLRYGRLEASPEEIRRAARLAEAEPFILALPEGYETRLQEGGAPLSTGQKQLLALARAILADPAIFIMDEATSSVDTNTEMLIQKALERLLEGRTSFIIAHRLRTIRKADRILVIENGRIVESGSHEELLQRDGRYASLCKHQLAATVGEA
jgi:ATP-binding cassette subfamily B protein